MFKRKLYDELLEWKRTSAGATAALVEGPRRVGKSTLAEQFAKTEYRSYLFIDFLSAPRSMRELFEDISDLEYLFTQLQFQTGTRLYPRESLVVFDEVQLCPQARQAIKYLVKDGRYDYLETGSLISIRQNTAGITIPSEERKFQLHPMDFEEFRWAQGDETTVPLLQSAFEHRTRLGDATNRKLMRDYRLYMLVGGMPQAVEEYLGSHNLQATDAVKRDIVSLYEEDFVKLDPTGALSALFDAIPAQLSNGASRYHVSSILANSRASNQLERIAQLVDSKAVLAAYHASDPNVGLSAAYDLSKFKLYLCDTGLFVTLAFKDSAFTSNDLYAGLLSDKVPANMGYVYEQAVAQVLASKGDRLFYHTWQNPVAKRNYEIDFMVTRGRKIDPIEVKSSKRQRHTSLDLFCSKYSARIGTPYLVSVTDQHKEGQIRAIPTYMAQFL